MANNVIVKNFDKDNNSFVINFGLQKDEGLRLFVIQNGNAYFASVDNKQLEQFANLHDMQLQTYIETLKQYIQEKSDNVSFVMTKTEFGVYRIAKQIKMKYFFAPLSECNYSECAEKVVDELITKNVTLLNKLKEMESRTTDLNKEIQVHKDMFEEFIQARHNNDKKIISGCLLILNEKKKKIQYLTNLLDAFRNKTIEYPQDKEAPVSNKREVVSDSDADTDNYISESDEDEEQSATRKSVSENGVNHQKDRRKLLDGPQPGPSREYASFLDDTSDSEPPKKKINCKTGSVAASSSVGNRKMENTEIKQEIDRSINQNVTEVKKFNTQDLLDML